MDLRPINPYYRRASTWAAKPLSIVAISGYSYPYSWIEPVEDRKQSDVDYVIELQTMKWEDLRAEQQDEYLNGLKGCMNYSDFLRIENNIQILIDVLELDNNSYVEAVPEFLTETYFENLQKNVAAIRQAYPVHIDTPAVPELPYNTWQKYNDIEKILADVYEVVNAQFYRFAGQEIYAGDEIGLLL